MKPFPFKSNQTKFSNQITFYWSCHMIMKPRNVCKIFNDAKCAADLLRNDNNKKLLTKQVNPISKNIFIWRIKIIFASSHTKPNPVKSSKSIQIESTKSVNTNISQWKSLSIISCGKYSILAISRLAEDIGFYLIWKHVHPFGLAQRFKNRFFFRPRIGT